MPSAEEKKEIRHEAVAAIRSLSLLDEQIQTLAIQLPDDKDVKELSVLVKKIRPVQMQVIKAAKKNKDDEAMLERHSIVKDSQKVNELSQQLVEKERSSLTEMQKHSAEKGLGMEIK